MKRFSEWIKSKLSKPDIITPPSSLEIQNSKLGVEIDLLRKALESERKDHQATRDLANANTLRSQKSMASLLMWIKVTHGINKLPPDASLRDLLQKDQ